MCVCSGINRFELGVWWQWRWWYRQIYIYILYTPHITYYANIQKCIRFIFVLLLCVFVVAVVSALNYFSFASRYSLTANTHMTHWLKPIEITEKQNTYIKWCLACASPLCSSSFNSVFFWNFYFVKFVWFVNLYAFKSE